MNQFIKNRFIILYSSILLMLPVLNGLHFILIDHDLSKNETIKKYLDHKCDEYTLFQVYEINNPVYNFSNPIEENKIQDLIFYYQNNYVLKLSVRLKNKGPPSLV